MVLKLQHNMNKILVWHLLSCSTCQRILKELNLNEKNSTMVDIKEQNISKDELEHIQSSLNSTYEELFNKRAMKFKLIKENFKSDEDYKKGILEEYTFLKRPIIKINENYFVGNSKKVIESTKEKLSY